MFHGYAFLSYKVVHHIRKQVEKAKQGLLFPKNNRYTCENPLFITNNTHFILEAHKPPRFHSAIIFTTCNKNYCNQGEKIEDFMMAFFVNPLEGFKRSFIQKIQILDRA